MRQWMRHKAQGSLIPLKQTSNSCNTELNGNNSYRKQLNLYQFVCHAEYSSPVVFPILILQVIFVIFRKNVLPSEGSNILQPIKGPPKGFILPVLFLRSQNKLLPRRLIDRWIRVTTWSHLVLVHTIIVYLFFRKTFNNKIVIYQAKCVWVSVSPSPNSLTMAFVGSVRFRRLRTQHVAAVGRPIARPYMWKTLHCRDV